MGLAVPVYVRFLHARLENDYKIVLLRYVGSEIQTLQLYSVERYSERNGSVRDVLDDL
jgi:hypothetical protein